MAKGNIGLPQINLSIDGVEHTIDESQSMEVVIEFKKGGVPREYINPVEAFAILDGTFYVTNRISDFVWSYKIKELKAVYLIPTGDFDV